MDFSDQFTLQLIPTYFNGKWSVHLTYTRCKTQILHSKANKAALLMLECFIAEIPANLLAKYRNFLENSSLFTTIFQLWQTGPSEPVSVNQFRHLREIRIIWILTRLLTIIMHNLRCYDQHLKKFHAYILTFCVKNFVWNRWTVCYFNGTFWLSLFYTRQMQMWPLISSLSVGYKSNLLCNWIGQFFLYLHITLNVSRNVLIRIRRASSTNICFYNT